MKKLSYSESRLYTMEYDNGVITSVSKRYEDFLLPVATLSGKDHVNIYERLEDGSMSKAIRVLPNDAQQFLYLYETIEDPMSSYKGMVLNGISIEYDKNNTVKASVNFRMNQPVSRATEILSSARKKVVWFKHHTPYVRLYIDSVNSQTILYSFYNHLNKLTRVYHHYPSVGTITYKFQKSGILSYVYQHSTSGEIEKKIKVHEGTVDSIISSVTTYYNNRVPYKVVLKRNSKELVFPTVLINMYLYIKNLFMF